MKALSGDTNGEYRYENGNLYVSKRISSGIIPELLPEKAWFRCMETDGDRFFWVALFGGLFGVHKFATRQYFQGLLYLLTFGVCGVFYVSDLVAILTGSYFLYDSTYDFSAGRAVRRRERLYSRPVEKKRIAISATICAAVSAVFIVKYGYRSILQGICAVMHLISQSKM